MSTVNKLYYNDRVSRNSSGWLTGLSVPFIVTDADGIDEAIRAVFDYLNDNREIQVENANLEDVEITEIINETTFKLQANYDTSSMDSQSSNDGSGNTAPGDIPEVSYSFNTTGGTMHIERSLKTVWQTTTEDRTKGGAINVDPDGNINGVDIVSANTEYIEEHAIPSEKFTTQYGKMLSESTGSMNNAPFREFQAGELLFCGVNANKKGVDAPYWNSTFRYLYSPNRVGVQIDNYTVPLVKGWDYLWKRYRAIYNEPTQETTHEIDAIYVERVYPELDFRQFGV